MANTVCFVDEAVEENCWNLFDSYGMICTGCNCCGKFGKAGIHEARLEVLVRQLRNAAEQLGDPDFKSNLQQRNILASIRNYAADIEEEMKYLDFGEPNVMEVVL